MKIVLVVVLDLVLDKEASEYDDEDEDMCDRLDLDLIVNKGRHALIF